MAFGCLAPGQKFVPMAWVDVGETLAVCFFPLECLMDLFPADVRLADVEFYFEILLRAGMLVGGLVIGFGWWFARSFCSGDG